MDKVGGTEVAASVQAVNDILQTAQKMSMDMSEKMVKLSVELSLGREPGKGGNIDTTA